MPLVQLIKCVIELYADVTLPQAIEFAKKYGLDLNLAHTGQNGKEEAYGLPSADGFSTPYIIASTMNESVEQLKATLADAGSIVRGVYYYQQDRQMPSKWVRQ